MAVHIEMDPANKIIERLGLAKGGRVQKYIDSECLRLSDPYTPKDNGLLIDSGTINTKIGQGQLIWDTPYARRWYYMPASFQGAPMRGNYWFDRMKKSGGTRKLINGVNAIMKQGGGA